MAASEQHRTGELLERSREMEELTRALKGARDGSGTTVIVSGDAGIGKTSLVRAFLDTIEDAAVLLGECDDLIVPRPLGPFREMARSGDHLAAELETDPDGDEILHRVGELLDRTLRPTVIVIDDVHWADEASLDIIRILVRRMPESHGLLILTAREAELAGDHPLRSVVDGPSVKPPLRLTLDPLSSEAVARLCSGTSHDAGTIFDVSAGNPFYVSQLLSSGPGDEITSARATVLARAERLSERGRQAMQTLSLLPEGADTTLARALFEDACEVFHEAELSGLLHVRGDRIRFRHKLARDAIEGSLTFGQRMAVSERIVEALLETGSDPSLLVHVARAAGDARRASAAALEVLDAGLVRDNHREVWALARIALGHTADLTPVKVAELHLAAAEAGRATNNHSEAQKHADVGIALLVDHQPGSIALANGWLTSARVHSAAGDRTRAGAALEAAKAIFEGHPVSHGLVRTIAMMAAAALIAGDRDEARRLATRSVEIAETRGWAQELVYGLGVRGIARGDEGWRKGLDDLERARDLGRVHGPADRHCVNTYNLAVRYLQWTMPIEAAPLLDEAERVASDHGLDNMVFVARAQRANLLVAKGNLAEAEALIQELRAQTPDPGGARSIVDAIMARIYTRRGDPEAAGEVERAWSGARSTGEIYKVSVAAISMLEFLWLKSDDLALKAFALEMIGLAEAKGQPRLKAEALRYLKRIGEEVGPFDGCPPAFRHALAGDHRKAAQLWEKAAQPYEQALELVESTDASIAFEGLRLLDRVGATRTADFVRQSLRWRGFASVPRGPRRTIDGDVPVLTDRQVDVIGLVAQGLTNQEIADELFVSRRTVDNHVSAILTRLRVPGRDQAVVEAGSIGLIPA
jgi:DNA-binding CsgD family transcriptional regulator/tetratricopeptide (TPR) repeat protein